MENPVWIDDFLENLKRAKERWDDPEYKAKLDEAFEQAADIMEVPTMKDFSTQKPVDYEKEVASSGLSNLTWLKYLAVFAAGALAVYFVFIKK